MINQQKPYRLHFSQNKNVLLALLSAAQQQK